MILLRWWDPPLKIYEIIESQQNFNEYMFNFSVSTVSADVLAPLLGVRPSAGTVMTKLVPCLLCFHTVGPLWGESIS